MFKKMTANEFKTHLPQKKSKYKNIKISFDGELYDSKAEFKYAALLNIRLKAGEISNLKRQTSFDLIAGNNVKIGVYKADFTFFDKIENRDRIVDVKGFETALFKLKKKIVEAIYGIEVECVKVK